ncbi:hypothetical protein N7468_003043 [Penicillium chermesinum]|uniref:Aminoglycoside phosphotransferase domain-containing protein n=1 Tax=Penicillium chermesinum TaxID=63820 RepID=A0A9W9P5V5_9EURO|nr:uncharacterized protein N7468_003043 [Penicillium chermesinum]KAJ5238424.1 hypothetical protein N7468_003043 [Penicillium chermesinum]KAJ6164086.1 hypothetical protein N7470_002758 [Penicillium chermesinum]
MASLLRHSIDIKALEDYICEHVPRIQIPIAVSQFECEQANGTYLIKDRIGAKYVMREKPTGQLVSQSAHNFEREYRVLRILHASSVPVPKIYCLCEETSVLGAPFYIREFLDGRIFEEPSFPGATPWERHRMWKEAVVTLAKLHSVDIDDAGLATYGRRTGFYQRQLRAWEDSRKAQRAVLDVEPVGPVPAVDVMADFFSLERYQPKDRACLIHGDYKIANLVFHKTEPRVIGILDWEMSTIGHPLADLATLLQPFTIVTTLSAAAKELLMPFQLMSEVPGLPTVAECLFWYRTVAGWNPTSELTWASAYSLFRTSIVHQRIPAAYAALQASRSTAIESARDMSTCAWLTLTLIRRILEADAEPRARI